MDAIGVKHDGELAIATGRSRFETSWKNRLMRWSSLVERLRRTTRTPETVKEYQKAAKARRDEIKDIGGFVGGSLKQGRRKAENIANRTLLTLDMDEVSATTEAVWASLAEGLKGCACVMYSTHTHTPASPRLRLVIPLSRPVMGDEYQAIARMLASDIGIDQFDDTTYEPHRLMYWPSTPQDGEYVFRFSDGPWMSPDEVLARYPDWRDVSYWPQSQRQTARITGQLTRQEDPLSKSGIVGAFCRAYSIEEAISAFLEGVYAPTGHEGRYTYTPGSTVGGVVIYEDKWAYSHHGTDPASGQLCNAFDLVRIHKFGSRDDDVKPDTAAGKLPSFVAMSEFAATDEATRALMGQEQWDRAKDEFDLEASDDEPEADATWMQRLQRNRNGEIVNSIANLRLIIDNDPRLKGRFAYNEFTNRNMVIGALPWDKRAGRVWSDVDDAGMRFYMERVYRIVGVNKILDAVNLTFNTHKYHPVRDYLNSLKWDGIPQVDTLLIDYLGAADTEYARTVMRKWLCGAVARVMRPGVKFDYMLVLTGAQGLYKSTFLRLLCGEEWFTDSLQDVEGTQAVEKLMGSWIVEFGELQAFSRSESSAIKRFITSQMDRTRLAYDRRITDMPRQCVFAGTTNKSEFLKDETGNRRYWPVEVRAEGRTKDVVRDLPAERDQLWAEAVELWKAGEKLYLDPEQEAQAIAQQTAHREVSEKAGLVLNYLDTLLPEQWDSWDVHQRRSFLQGVDVITEGTRRRDRVCVMEIWCECFGKQRGDLKDADSREIGSILGALGGWRRSDKREYFGDYGQQRGYERV